MTRYASEGKFVGYAGLAPITQRSADTVHHGPAAECGQPLGAGRVDLDDPDAPAVRRRQRLSQYYARQKARLGWQIARVATARQLARVIYHMLRTGEVWRETPTPGGPR